MKRLTSKIIGFFQAENGATSIEYALIAGAMAIMLVAAMPSIATPLQDKLVSLGTSLSK
jgi:Flp pilus assembly pilin Flp